MFLVLHKPLLIKYYITFSFSRTKQESAEEIVLKDELKFVDGAVKKSKKTVLFIFYDSLFMITITFNIIVFVLIVSPVGAWSVLVRWRCRNRHRRADTFHGRQTSASE